jgi:hypothetical protein
MVIAMKESKLATLEQIREFLAGTSDVAFAIPGQTAKVLQRFRYFSRPKGQRGLSFEYMQRLSGYSRQHLSRLIAQFAIPTRSSRRRARIAPAFHVYPHRYRAHQATKTA